MSMLVFFKNPFNKEVFLLWSQALLVGMRFVCIFPALKALLGVYLGALYRRRGRTRKGEHQI